VKGRMMSSTILKDSDAVATVAVRNLDVAGKFYRDTLGLEQIAAQDGEAITLRSGRSTINVYRSEFAGTNKATALSWTVGADLDATVRDLKAKGVAFEHYEMPNATHRGDIHVFGDFETAWFKDPDGNILNLIGG
jgi:catechol 2,3-dioxygenase-like lactoylglutathione lyase family enzyme